jgi:hypothetical protein
MCDRTRHANGCHEPLHRWCERNGIVYHAEVIDVGRKRDL